MSEPRTINGYLAALNACLEVGLRSRRRILAEVEDHLCQAIDEQVRRGIGPREAQWRAIAAFGPAEQVAARFDGGLIGALDRRLARGARWAHCLLTQRRWGIPALAVAVSMLFAAVLGAFSAAFGRDPLLAASGCLSGGAAFVTLFIVSRRFRRQLRDITHNSAATMYVPYVFAYPAVLSCLVLLSDTYSVVEHFVAIMVVYVVLGGTQVLTERAITLDARAYVEATERDGQQVWSADHPWRAAAAAVAPLPLGLVTLIAVFPAPASAALRVALIAVVGVLAALAAVAVRLECARRERDAFHRVFMSASW